MFQQNTTSAADSFLFSPLLYHFSLLIILGAFQFLVP